MDVGELLAAYDDQLRVQGELYDATRREAHGPLWWASFADGWGFVTYRSLDGVAGAELDTLIEETVAHFRADPTVGRFEWKTRGHDAPDDLGERLEAHGLHREDLETVMIGECAALATPVRIPSEVTLRRVLPGAGLLDDVRRAVAMQEAVFGSPGMSSPETLAGLLEARPDEVQLWIAEVAGDVVCAGRLQLVPGTDFAGIWGGATVRQWRGRGIYRALTAARAAAALELGARFVHSDSSPMSRPILERSGLRAVTTTTPYVWRR